MLLPANAVCPTQHWLWSCLLHASQDPNRRTGTQWGCFCNNRGCLAYDAIALRACTMRHVYLSPRVKKCWKRRENRGFCLRESKIGGRQFLHTCKIGVARESFSVRQYLSKSADFRTLTIEQVRSIMKQLNNRPRKCLGFKTPNQLFSEINPPVALTS